MSNNELSIDGRSIDEILNLAAAKLSAGDMQGAYDYLTRVTELPSFSTQSEDIRSRVFFGLGFAEAGLSKAPQALKHLELARPLGDDNPMFWQMYMYAAGQTEDFPRAVHAAAILASRFPEMSSVWTDKFLFALLRESRGVTEAESDRMVLLDALWRNQFSPEDSTRSMDTYWIELIDAKLAANDPEGAAAVARAVSAPDGVQDLAVNLAYSEFAPSDPAKTWKEAAERQIEMYRGLVKERPNEAKSSSRLAAWLSRTGNPAEALIVLDAAITRIEEAPRGVNAFEDQADYLEWLHNGRAVALLNMGLWNEALQAQEESYRVAQAVEAGSVSQAVNLAEIYLDVGQFDRAIETAKTANPDLASVFGQMSAKWAEACATKMAGRATDAKAIVASMAEMTKMAFAPVAAAVICVESEGDAAKFMIDSLNDEATRGDALKLLQKSLRAKSPPAAYVQLNDRLDALRGRDDVRSVVAQYGKIIEWPYY